MTTFLFFFFIVVLLLSTITYTTAASNSNERLRKSNRALQLNEAALPSPPTISTTVTNTTTSDYVNPDFRWILYSNLTEEQVNYVTTLNYTEETWNLLGSNPIEYYAFLDIDLEQQNAATQLGFTEGTWDCDQNHYGGYYWSDLVTYDLDKYWSALGWNQSSWEGILVVVEEDGDDNETETDSYYYSPETSVLRWDNLTASEQEAATEICFFKESWNDISMEKWECYDEGHYTGYNWTELEIYNIDEYMIELGWSQEMWEGSGDYPETSWMYWSELTASQQEAASAICYTQELWDGDEEDEDEDEYELTMNGNESASVVDAPEEEEEEDSNTDNGDGEDGGEDKNNWVDNVIEVVKEWLPFGDDEP